MTTVKEDPVLLARLQQLREQAKELWDKVCENPNGSIAKTAYRAAYDNCVAEVDECLKALGRY